MKKFLALAMAAAMSLSLVACGGSSAAPAASEAAPAPDAAPAASEETVAPDADAFADCGDYELIVSNHDAATSVGEKFVEDLLTEISDATGGHITYQFNPGGSLFGGKEAVEQVEYAGCDVTWNATSITTGRFLVSEFVSLPLNGITCARMASKVLQDMYASVPELQDEYKDFYVIELQGNCSAPISTKGVQIQSADDFKGLNLRAAGTTQSTYITDLGAGAQGMPTGEVYEAMSKGVVQGFTNDWHNIDCFKLYEVVDYVLDCSVSNTACFMLMNKDTFEGFDQPIQDLFKSYQTYGSDMAGYYWDAMRSITGAEMEANGAVIYAPSDELKAVLESQEEADAMMAWYLQYLQDNGYSAEAAQAIIDAGAAAVAKYAPDFQDPYADGNRIETTKETIYQDWLASVGK